MRFLVALTLSTVWLAAAIPAEKFESVRTLLREKKLAAAESAARALVAANAQDAEALGLLGSVLAAKGDGDAAVKACEQAVALAPMSGELQRLLGDAYGTAAQSAGMLGKMSLGKKCLAAYEKAVELEPTNLAARQSLATIYQQAPAMMGGGMDKAYAQAAEVKKLDAQRGRVTYALLYTSEKKYADAFAQLDEALKAEPDNYAALFQSGRVAALSGDRVDEGLAALRRCLGMPAPAGSPGHDAAHWRLGNLWEKKGDKAAARAAYEAALKVTPNYPQAVEALKKLG